MKRSTAVGHLREMAQVAQEHLSLGDTDIGWPLEELWVTGELVDGAESLEYGTVVLSLDLPVGELTWLAVHPAAEWIGHQLRLGKRPFRWFYRPAVWPAWNASCQQVIRVWSATAGVETSALDALASGVSIPNVAAPMTEDFRVQMRLELEASRRHLAFVLDSYWEHDWRREQRGDHPPEDHLWRAAQAVREIADALTA